MLAGALLLSAGGLYTGYVVYQQQQVRAAPLAEALYTPAELAQRLAAPPAPAASQPRPSAPAPASSLQVSDPPNVYAPAAPISGPPPYVAPAADQPGPSAPAPASSLQLSDPPNVYAPAAPISWPPPYAVPAAISIAIPSIDVYAKVVQLGTTYDEKGELVWETPNHAVGHHIGTAHAGEAGNAVYSGHMSSPVKGEGNIFNKLPDVKLGDTVFLETADDVIEYRIIVRQVVEPTAVSVMAPTAAPVITLITCYPDLVYSHRLVLTGELAAQQPKE